MVLKGACALGSRKQMMRVFCINGSDKYAGRPSEPGRRAHKAQATEPGEGAAHPRRIMIVEDERIVAMDLSAMLRRLGYDVCAVTASGEEALRLAPEVMPDVILMDIMLEGALDGVETARLISREYGVPIIYASAYTDAQTQRRANATNPGAFLVKPVNFRSLKEAFNTLFKSHA